MYYSYVKHFFIRHVFNMCSAYLGIAFSSEVFSTDVNSVNKNQRDVCHFGPFTGYIEAINDWHDPHLRSAVKRSL